MLGKKKRRSTLEALRRARVDAGLTISELAKRAGVSRDTISHAERGRHSLQGPTMSKIAYALGRAPSELLAEEERLFPKAERRSSPEPSLFYDLEEERREGQTVQDVREAYLPFRESLEDYCARWERLLEDATPLARGDVEEFVYAAVDLKPFLLAARASELTSLGEALLSAGEPFYAKKLQDLSILQPAFRRYYALMHALVERLPKEEAEELRPRLRSIQGEMTA
jgi:transcriptional regulator with XRE-family HTH domain